MKTKDINDIIKNLFMEVDGEYFIRIIFDTSLPADYVPPSDDDYSFLSSIYIDDDGVPYVIVSAE